MSLPKSFTTVTPLSKLSAAILFIVLPFICFLLGTKFQVKQPQNFQYIVKEKIVRVPVVDDKASLIQRCGDIPINAYPKQGHYDVVSDMVWAPDCRHIAWSLWESGTGYLGNDSKVLEEIANNPRTLSGREGVFIYNDSNGLTKKIFNPSGINEIPELINWKNKDTLIFKAGEKILSYDFLTDQIQEFNN